MQHQQQPPQMLGGMPPQQPPNTLVTTEHIQKCLDENKNLIMAIMESHNMGKLNECAQYQAQLQKNLMYLAAIADAQPPPPTVISQPQSQSQAQPQPQMAMQSTIPQGPSMQPPQPTMPQQPPQPVMPQQQAVAYGARMPFQGQPFDQQSQHIQHQQTMAGMMGMRMGGNMGLHPAMQPGHGAHAHFMDARSRQDGSEGGSGDGQGK